MIWYVDDGGWRYPWPGQEDEAKKQEIQTKRNQEAEWVDGGRDWFQRREKVQVLRVPPGNVVEDATTTFLPLGHLPASRCIRPS